MLLAALLIRALVGVVEARTELLRRLSHAAGSGQLLRAEQEEYHRENDQELSWANVHRVPGRRRRVTMYPR